MTKGSNIFVNDVFDNVSSDTNISLKKPNKGTRVLKGRQKKIFSLFDLFL